MVYKPVLIFSTSIWVRHQNQAKLLLKENIFNYGYPLWHNSNLPQMLAVWNQWIKKITYHNKLWFIPGMQYLCIMKSNPRLMRWLSKQRHLPLSVTSWIQYVGPTWWMKRNYSNVVLSPPNVCHGTHPSFPHSPHKINECENCLKRKFNIFKLPVLPQIDLYFQCDCSWNYSRLFL